MEATHSRWFSSNPAEHTAKTFWPLIRALSLLRAAHRPSTTTIFAWNCHLGSSFCRKSPSYSKTGPACSISGAYHRHWFGPEMTFCVKPCGTQTTRLLLYAAFRRWFLMVWWITNIYWGLLRDVIYWSSSIRSMICSVFVVTGLPMASLLIFLSLPALNRQNCSYIVWSGGVSSSETMWISRNVALKSLP